MHRHPKAHLPNTFPFLCPSCPLRLSRSPFHSVHNNPPVAFPSLSSCSPSSSAAPLLPISCLSFPPLPLSLSLSIDSHSHARTHTHSLFPLASQVTGANSGLGRGIATHLLSLGCNVTLAVRRPTATLVAEMETEAALWYHGNWTHALGRASLLAIDLANLKSVQRALAELTTPFDALVLNAGVAPSQTYITRDGLESAFQINFLAHYFFLREMLAGNAIQSGGHVVVVTSETHRTAAALNLSDFGQPRQFDFTTSMYNYGYTKQLVTTYAHQLARGHPHVTINSFCPGPVTTDIARDGPAWATAGANLMMQLFDSPRRAALPVRTEHQGVPSFHFPVSFCVLFNQCVHFTSFHVFHPS